MGRCNTISRLAWYKGILMNGFKRIAVIGDSFCRYQEEETDWPVHLGKLLGVKSFGKGNGGNAWWTARRFLKKHYANDTSDVLLIVVHTEASRLPNDNEIPMNLSVLKTFHSPEENEFTEIDPTGKIQSVARDFYQSQLFSIEFYEWAQQAWIKELDDAGDNFYKIILNLNE